MKTETDKVDADKESCLQSLHELQSNGLTSIEKLVRREINELECQKNEQNNLLEAIQKSIETVVKEDMVGDTKQRGTSGLYNREDMESNLKVSKWLNEQGETTVDGGNVSKGIQAGPEVVENGMQTSPDVMESGIQTSDNWIKEQEMKGRFSEHLQEENTKLQEKIVKETSYLSDVVRGKSVTIASLENQLEQAKQSQTNFVSTFESNLAQARHESKLELEILSGESDKRCNVMLLEKEQLSAKLEERENRIKSFKKEITDLQAFCKDMRTKSNDSKKTYDDNIRAVNEELRHKVLKVDELEKEVYTLKLSSKSFEDANRSFETRKHQLVNEVNELKRFLDKCKMEKDIFHSKFNEMKSHIAEKTKSYNEKIDNFLTTEKKYRFSLKDTKSKLIDCEEQLRKKEEKLNLLKIQSQEVEEIKKGFNEKMDELKDELEKESKSKLAVSERYISLEKKFQTLEQNYFRLEQRSTVDKQLHQSELESCHCEAEKLKDSEFELTSRFDSLKKEHEHCIKRKFDLERDFRQKESKLQTEMEIVLKESSSDYQRQIENLKAELREMSSAESSRHELESQLKKLTRENKEMTDSLNHSMADEGLEKKRSAEQIFKLETTVKGLNDEKQSLKSHVDFLKEQHEQHSQESKTKQEDFKDEVLYYKSEIATVRQTLQDQLKLCKQLQEERQDGGLQWQNEKREVAKELERSKDKIKDAEISHITIKEKCRKLTNELNVLKKQQELDDQKFSERLEGERRRTQQIEIDHAKLIEVLTRKEATISQENEDMKQVIKDLELARDVRMAKLETSEKMCRENNDSIRSKNSELVLKNQRLEQQNRDMSLLISTQEEKMRSLRKDNCNQSVHVTKIEDRLESLEGVKTELKTANLYLKEKLDVVEKDYQRVRMEASQYPMCLRKAEKLEDENARLKEQREELAVEAGKIKENIKLLEGDQKVLKKQCNFAEEIQHSLQQKNEDLQLKLKGLASAARERLSNGKEELAQTRFDYEQEINEKGRRINTLNDQISKLRQDLALSKTKQSDCENKSIREVQQELDKMTSIHHNEIKINLITIEALKRENNDLKQKVQNMSEESVNKYKKELNSLLASHADEIETMDSKRILMQRQIDQLNKEISILHENTMEKFEVDQLTASHIQDLKTRDKLIVSLKTKVEQLQERIEHSGSSAAQNVDALLANHKSQIKSREDTIFSLKEKLVSRITETEEGQRVLFNQKSEILSRDEIIASLRIKIETLQKTLDSKFTHEEAIQELSTNHKAEIESRDVQISNLKDFIENLKTSFSTEAKSTKETLSNHLSEIESRKAKINELEIETRNLNSAFSLEKTYLLQKETSLHGQVDTLRNEILKLNRDNASDTLSAKDNQKNEILKWEDQIKSLKAELSKLHNNNATAKDELRKLGDSKESEIDTLRKQVNTLQKQIEMFENAKVSETQSLTVKEMQEVTNREVEIESLKAELSKLHNTNATAKDELRKLSDSKESEIDTLRKQIEMFENAKLCDTQSLTVKQRKEIEEREDKIKSLQTKLAELEKSSSVDKEKFQKLIINKEIEVTTLQKQIEISQNEIQKMTNKQTDAENKAMVEYDQHIKSLEVKISDLEKINLVSNDKCQKLIESKKNELDSREKLIRGQQEKIKNLQQSIKQGATGGGNKLETLSSNQKSDLKSSDTEKLTNEIKNLKAQLAAEKDQITGFKHILEESRRSAEETSYSLKEKHEKELQLEKQNMDNKIKEITSQSRRYQTDLKEHETKHKELMNRIQQLEKDLQQRAKIATTNSLTTNNLIGKNKQKPG